MSPDDIPRISLAFLILMGVAAVLTGAAYFFVRARSGEPMNVPLRYLFRVYLFIVTIASLLVLIGGLSHLLTAGFGAAFGKDFSYNPNYYPTYAGQVEPARPPPSKDTVPPPMPPPEEQTKIQEEQRERGLTRALQEGLLKGVSMTVVGAIIWGVHALGRRRLETKEEATEILSRAYLILLLIIFSIITLTSLPSAIFETLRFSILESPTMGEFRSPPGGKLATALIALPIWLMYLRSTVAAIRGRQQ